MLRKLVPEFIKAQLRPLRPTYSQAGQDLWVSGEVFNGKRGGYFVDVGAHDGIDLSNTYTLERRYDWTGICVEANPDTFTSLKRNRQATCINLCVSDSEGEASFVKHGMFGQMADGPDAVRVKTSTLAAILKSVSAPAKIDYLSMDIEGAEEQSLRDFPFAEYHITCMTIERPSNALKAILERNGFALIKEIPGLDCFYIRREMEDAYLSNVFAYYEKLAKSDRPA